MEYLLELLLKAALARAAALRVDPGHKSDQQPERGQKLRALPNSMDDFLM
jgi:hypothetical protein